MQACKSTKVLTSEQRKICSNKPNVKHKKLNDLTFDLVFHMLKYEKVSMDGFCQHLVNIYFILAVLNI